MRHGVLRWSLLGATLAVASGCHPQPTPRVVDRPAPPVAAAPPPRSDWGEAPLEAILRETARRSCLATARCRSYLCMPIGALAEVCHPARVEPRIARALRAHRAGDVRFDRARALAILEELATGGSCRDQPRSGVCDRGIDRTTEALIGSRGAGEACRVGYECKSAACSYDGRSGGVCRATTARRPFADGDDRCRRGADCLPGRICSEEEGCVPPIAAGEPCGPHLGPSRLSACADGLVCTAAGCALGIDVGGACANDGSTDPCRHGTECRAGACVEVGAPLGPCGASGHCPESFFCDAGACEPLPVIGEPCTGDCADGTCEEGVCAPIAVGERCVGALFGGGTCADGARCDLRADRCVAP